MPVDFGWLGLPQIDHVHRCHWRALLRSLPGASVDMLFADMPYNTTACDWDGYIVPLDAFWRHVKRVMKPRGAVVLTGSQPFTSKLVMSNPEWFKYEWVWAKTRASDFINAKNKPMKAHENVLVFSEGTTANGSARKMAYNPQGVRAYGVVKYRPGGTVATTVVGFRPSHVKQYIQEETGFPTSVLRFSNDNNLTEHPTQKPVALLEYLIRTYTHPGALVVDPFAGSGTTAVAAANTGRHYIVGDISAQYVDIARRRLSLEFGRPAPKRDADPDPADLGPLFAHRA